MLKIVRINPISQIRLQEQLSDYRLISVLPVLSKIYEKLVRKRIVEFIANHELYKPIQTGLREKYCTSTLLVKFRDDIVTALITEEVTIAIFAAFSKASDTSGKCVLIKKLRTFNFLKRFLYWRKYLQ